MDEKAKRDEIEDLIEACLDGSAAALGPPSGAFAERGAGKQRVRALLHLLAHQFPDELVPEVLGCAAEDIALALTAVRRRLPDPESVRAFLEAQPRCGPETLAGGRTPVGVRVSETAELALETLHYWTEMWLDDDADVERTHGEPELSS